MVQTYETDLSKSVGYEDSKDSLLAAPEGKRGRTTRANGKGNQAQTKSLGQRVDESRCHNDE